MKWFSGMVLAATLGVATTAHAEDWKAVGQFGWFGVGKAYELEKGHVYWVGEFSGIFFSDKGKDGLFERAGVRCPGFNNLDFNNKKGSAAGTCIISDAAGDQAFAIWTCEGDSATCTGTFDYTGGTGRYSGISGHNTFVAATNVQWKDGTASGQAVWNR